jgi:hypothetical protein
MRFDMTDDTSSKSTSDTERSPAPETGTLEAMLEAIAEDLAKLEATTNTLAEGIHELVARLRWQAADLRGKP